jgi:thiol:disulfide interchange protein
LTRKRNRVDHPKSVPNWLPRLAALLIVAVIAFMIVQSKNKPQVVTILTNEIPEVQLDRLLEEGEPVFLFVHSNNCYSCIEMTKVVEEVYPEYAQNVALIDVDVYDSRNQNLLRRVNIYSIPTQIFIDREGQGQVAMGLMKPEQLRKQLDSISYQP